MSEEVVMIPMDRIRIINPRVREKGKFAKIVESIKTLGLKKPIQVSLRQAKDGEDPGYDLVYGQGRMEACQVLGYKEIPAIIVEISKEDRMLRSLVENMARRFPMPMDLMNEIERLKLEGYSNVAIGKKLGISDPQVGGYLALKNAGEERVLDAAIKGKIPISVAIEIAKTNDVETQRELLKVYENKQLNSASIRTMKRLIDQRQFLGKGLRGKKEKQKKPPTTAEGMVRSFRKESQKQKAMVKKARLCEAKLIVLVSAFKKLLSDENFINLLRAERLSTYPKYLSDKIKFDVKEAA